MNTESTLPLSPDDPVTAFNELRGEVSVLRRALESLAAERQNVIDYTPTLTEISQRLAQVEEDLGVVSQSPALNVTPAGFADSLIRASEAVRKNDRELLEITNSWMKTAVDKINGIVQRSLTADEQWRWLYWTGGLCGLAGAVAMLMLVRLFSSEPPPRATNVAHEQVSDSEAAKQNGPNHKTSRSSISHRERR